MRLHGAKQKSFGLGCHELTCIYKGRGIQTAVLNHHGLDRSQWPAHSYLRANSFPAEQRWLSWVWNKCFILPLQGPARQRLRQCHSFRTVFLQHCKQDQIDLCCLFALYNPRVIRVGNNIRRSLNPTSVQSTGHTELRNFLFGAFLQSGLKNYQGFWTTSSNTLLSSKWLFLLFTSSLKLSFQLVPLTSQPPAVNPCAELGSISSQILGMLSSSLKSSLPQAGQVLLPEPLITGQACQVLTIVQALTPSF